MTVTFRARHLSALERPLFAWSGSLPVAIVGVRATGGLPKGNPLELGAEIHAALDAYCRRKPVRPGCREYCEAVHASLLNLGIENASIRSEVPLGRGRISGQADLVGRLAGGAEVVCEVKATRGLLRPPDPAEVFQAAAYGALLPSPGSHLVFIRICPRLGKLAVYTATNADEFVKRAEEVMHAPMAAAA